MKNTSRSYAVRGFLGIIMILGCAACAGDRHVVVLKPVGPTVLATKVRATGYLIVNTAIEEPASQIYFDTHFYPHSAYAIYDGHGAFVRTVRNHLGAWDETLDRVSLAPGRYTIFAESEVDGEVAVPVIIECAKTTVVNLKRHEHSLAAL